MKKLLLALIVVFTLVLQTNAQNYRLQSLVNGSALASVQGSGGLALVIVPTTVTTGANYTNDLGQLITAGTNSVGITYGPWERDVQVYANRNADAGSAALALSIYGGATNGIGFTLARSLDGTNFDTDITTASDGVNGTFQVFVTNNTASDTTPVTVVTNLPSWFMLGTRSIRVNSIISQTNAVASTNTISIKLGQYVP